MNIKIKETNQIKPFLSFVLAIALLLGAMPIGSIAAFGQESDAVEMDLQAEGSYGVNATDPSSILEIEPVYEQEITAPMTPMIRNTNFSGGSGTEQDPFIIATAPDLVWLAYFVNINDTNFNDRHYRLESDIDLSSHGQNWNNGQGWMPIGIDTTNSFRGVFDGNGHVISNLFINRATDNIGLFGYITGATIKNIGVINVNITSTSGGAGGVGGVVGTMDSNNNVLYSYSTGIVNGQTRVGGIAGRMTGNKNTISDSYSTAAAIGMNNSTGCFAGILGCLMNGTVNNVVRNTYSTGVISGHSNRIAGIVGGGGGHNIQNNVALNPSVTNFVGILSGFDNVGRVISTSTHGSPNIERNHALSTMTPGGGIPFPAGETTHNGGNGADLTMERALSRDFWTTTTPEFTALDEDIWYIQDGELPVLRAFRQTSTETIVSIPDLDVGRGTQVAIPVSIENNPGLSTFEMVVHYDPEIMTPVGVQLGDAAPGFFIAHNLNFAPDGVSITGANTNNPKNDGNIIYVIFDIDLTAPLGTYPVEIELRSFNTLQGVVPTPIDPVIKKNGSVAMIPVLAGDIDGDGYITADDALMILLYLAGEIELEPWQRIAADVNQDGVIDILDANLILMIAAGSEQAPGWFSEEISDFEEAEIEEPLANMPQGNNVISVPISIENNVGLSGFDITLRYDNERLAPIGFTQGDAWQDLIVFNPEAGDDFVKLIGASAFNGSTDGTIVNVMFEMIGDDVALITDDVELEVEGLTQIDGLDAGHLSGYQVKESTIVFNE